MAEDSTAGKVMGEVKAGAGKAADWLAETGKSIGAGATKFAKQFAAYDSGPWTLPAAIISGLLGFGLGGMMLDGTGGLLGMLGGSVLAIGMAGVATPSVAALLENTFGPLGKTEKKPGPPATEAKPEITASHPPKTRTGALDAPFTQQLHAAYGEQAKKAVAFAPAATTSIPIPAMPPREQAPRALG